MLFKLANLFAAGQDHLSIWKLLCMAHVSSSKNISLWMMRSTVSAGLDFPVTAPEARWPCLTEGVTGLRTPLLSTPEETYSKYEAVFEKGGPSLSLPSVNLFDQPECLHMGCVKPRTSSFVETRAWIRGSRIQRQQTRVCPERLRTFWKKTTNSPFTRCNDWRQEHQLCHGSSNILNKLQTAGAYDVRSGAKKVELFC